MKEIIRISGKIMKDLRTLTGWNFIGGVKGNICLLNAKLVSEEGVKTDVSLRFQGADVLIMTTVWGDSFEKEAVDGAVQKLDFPVETEIKEDSLIISHHEPLGVLEHSIKGVLKQCIIPMVIAAAQAALA
ncbi:hypothetical protein D3Z36_09510 [Lachnospiraceae bacterium]|nr:hypothetical protein [Lachnospiraceae bacterium]